MRRVSRAAAVAAAVAVQALLVAVAVAPRLSARLTGEEYLLRVEPVDPIDPFRGAYVTLSYPDLLTDDYRPIHGKVFVPLVEEGGVWKGTDASQGPPSEGPYIECRYDGRLRCGIESLFASQGKARSLERELASGGAVARVKIDSRGHAVVLGLTRLAER
ncbi:MAG TPA: GDYXXLXY domain-containing protein [Mycobacteriales bacterium]|nr:GDYXXLXY domain-containing protein [Mycobacteriales bacterium]